MLLKGPWRGAAPGAPSKLNGRSALSKGLIFAFSGHHGLDLVSGTRPTNTGAVENATFNKRGWAFAGGALGASQLDFGTLATTAGMQTGPATWAFFTISNDGNVQLATQNDNNGSQGWQVGSDRGNSATLGLEFPGAGQDLRKSISDTTPINTPFTAVYTTDGTLTAAGVNIYLNGVRGTTNVSIDSLGGSGAATTHPVLLGAKQYLAAASYNGTIFVALMANRIWSDAEVKSFHANPYQVFETPLASTFSFSNDAPGSIAGTIAAISGLTGTLRGVGAMSAVFAATSNLIGSLTQPGVLTGSIAAASNLTGTLSQSFLAGSIAATSALIGTLSSRGLLGGSINALSALTGTLINNATVNVIATSPIDSLACGIVFSQAVNQSDAVNPANYSVNHGLTVTNVLRITDSHYVLCTSRQVQGVVYTLTISNIRGM